RSTPPLNENELRNAVQSALKTGVPRELKIVKFQPGDVGAELGNDTPDDSRPIVLLPGNGIEDRHTAVCLGRLLDATGRFYDRGGALVSLSRDDDGAPVLIQVKAAAVSTEFEEVAELRKINKYNVEVHAICYRATAERIITARVFLEALPAIHVISPVPVLIERDGELVQISDYDRESGVLAHGPSAPDMNLDEANSLLAELIADYDFVTPSDRSRALASVIVPALVMGDLLDGRAPLDLGEANQSQAGKGYRLKVGAAVYGRRVATVTQRSGGVGSVEESFSAHLIAGRTFISFDNLRGKFDIPAVESFMTEDSYIARVPYAVNVLIDARRFLIMMTSNRAELTPDMAKRSSIIRINKQSSGYAFRKYDEGDLLDHVRANSRRFLGAVFAVVRAWYEAGKPRSNETGHDFRAWAQTLDWIVREVLGEAPLLEGHQAAKTRVATPHLTWLRDVTLEVAKNDRLDEPLRTHQLLDLLAAAEIEIPGVESGSDLDDKQTRNKALRAMGGRLKRCFGQDTVEVDRFRIQRATFKDPEGR
ncbi:MAG: hypothetical protein IID33_13045, partial [Planctomycetes bacterium]|nr:hypothetical protein [Planctomycetota bacterium]